MKKTKHSACFMKTVYCCFRKKMIHEAIRRSRQRPNSWQASRGRLSEPKDNARSVGGCINVGPSLQQADRCGGARGRAHAASLKLAGAENSELSPRSKASASVPGGLCGASAALVPTPGPRRAGTVPTQRRL